MPKPLNISFPHVGEDVPLANYALLTQTGVMSVVAEITGAVAGDAFQVFAVIKDATDSHEWEETLPSLTSLPDGAVKLDRVGNTSVYLKNNIPVTSVLPFEPVVNNKRVFAAYYEPAASTLVRVDRDEMPFKAWPYILGEVSAKHCLWLVYAPPGISLPLGETTNAVDGYLPASFRIPAGAESVFITVRSGYWRSSPDILSGSDAQGIGTPTTTSAAHLAGYKNATLQPVVAIDDVATALNPNRLVGLWQHPDPGTPSQIFDALAPPNEDDSFPILGGATHLRLGFHESHDWTNNFGMVQVLIRWA